MFQWRIIKEEKKEKEKEKEEENIYLDLLLEMRSKKIFDVLCLQAISHALNQS